MYINTVIFYFYAYGRNDRIIVDTVGRVKAVVIFSVTKEKVAVDFLLFFSFFKLYINIFFRM